MLEKKILRAGDELCGAFSVRIEVFVEEQRFSRELEIDETDKIAGHVLFLDDGKPVATGRAFPDVDNPGEYIFGRIAVLKPYRKTGLGQTVMAALEDFARENGAVSASLGAQVRARGFYEKCGYEVYGDEYLDEYCPHIHMRKSL